MSPLVVTPPASAAGTLAPVQRLFSMFPTAGPGVGLLLLRLAVALALVAGAVDPTPLAPLGLVSPIAVMLGAGLMTPILAVGAAALHVVRIAVDPLMTSMLAPHVMVAAAVALLGPGAYSLDARRFGRRLVVTPPVTGE
jgi:hypothetical protein